jgi:hypothetical protein
LSPGIIAKNDSDYESNQGNVFDMGQQLSAEKTQDYHEPEPVEDDETRLARIEAERLHQRELERQK